MMNRPLIAIALVAALAVGCSVNTSKNESGKDKDVAIKTPFGNMNVKTADVKPEDTGLSVFPDSRLMPETEHNDSKAKVNIDTPWFGVKVAAFKYETDAAPDKVIDYYKKELAKLGEPLVCQGTKVISGHEGTGKDDLKCSGEHAHVQGVNIDSDSATTQIKVGTETRQHVVAVKPRGKGSEFDLVYVQVRGGEREPA